MILDVMPDQTGNRTTLLLEAGNSRSATALLQSALDGDLRSPKHPA